jgi:hypothetical protein
MTSYGQFAPASYVTAPPEQRRGLGFESSDYVCDHGQPTADHWVERSTNVVTATTMSSSRPADPETPSSWGVDRYPSTQQGAARTPRAFTIDAILGRQDDGPPRRHSVAETNGGALLTSWTTQLADDVTMEHRRRVDYDNRQRYDIPGTSCIVRPRYCCSAN